MKIIPDHVEFFRAQALAAIKNDREKGLADGEYTVDTLRTICDMASNVVGPDDRFTAADKAVWNLFYYYL